MTDRKQVKLDGEVTICQALKEHMEGDVISYEVLKMILSDFSITEFMDAQSSLLITQYMVSHFNKLQTAIKYEQGITSLLQGPSGVGKTITLLYIGHMARSMGYLVFPVQARDFVNRAEPMSVVVQEFLSRWIGAVGENMLIEIFGDDLFHYIVKIIKTNLFQGDEEKEIIDIFKLVVRTLRMYEARPVVFLVDQCNAFNTSPQMIKLYSDSKDIEITCRQNPIGSMFLDWNTFKVRRGGIFYGFSAAFQLMPSGTDGNAALFTKMEPMNRKNFQIFVTFLVEQNRLPQECDCDALFELCGGIPREALEFRLENLHLFKVKSTFQQWKVAYMNARIPFYKMKIQGLLDIEQLGPDVLKQIVSFASSLFVGEKVVSAPDVWIASGLVVTTDGFQKLFCPAAENALLSVFKERDVIRKAINMVRYDPMMRWKRLELAVVDFFRRSNGIPIEFYCTNLCGKKEKRMTITARWIQHGGRIPPETQSVPRNTMFIGVRKTPVVDLFIHDANGAQILIQASEPIYRDRIAKYGPEDQDIKLYSAAARDPEPGAKLKYIYLTPPSNRMSTYKKNRKDVFLVAEADMMRLFESLY